MDVLILYDPDTDLDALLTCADQMMNQGKKVRLELSEPEGIRAEEKYHFTKKGLKEAEKHA